MVGMQSIRLRNDFFQLGFHVPRLFPGRQSGTVADTKHVGIDGKRRFTEGHVHNNVRGFSSDPRQLLKLVSVGRNLAAMVV